MKTKVFRIPASKKTLKTKGNDSFILTCKSLGMDAPTPEYRFVEDRRWRIDYAWVDIMLAVEIEGAVFTGGRHVRGIGYAKDMEKYNRMSIEGWLLLRYMPAKIKWDEIEAMYLLNKEVKKRLKKI